MILWLYRQEFCQGFISYILGYIIPVFYTGNTWEFSPLIPVIIY
jgi:hypothetical protein